ncbi:hypothetical protein RRF57_012498 [Xylaria bambusicola]|uniref:Uncharacterized protein n=1 Tax=Xylaria bambusicola TaxID=326684 RepID=A0AAN7ZAR9_9PEZI
MADGAYVNGGLSGDDFGGGGRQSGDVEILGICLRRERRSLDGLGGGSYGILEDGLGLLLSLGL